jgi:hypothetical protein
MYRSTLKKTVSAVPQFEAAGLQAICPETRKGPGGAGASAKVARDRLLERGLDAREGRVQACAEARDDGDDGDRDAGGDQAVFDGGRTRLILHETRNEVLHSELLMGPHVAV